MSAKLDEMMERVCMLEDLFESAVAEDDRCTARKVLLELEEINKQLDELEREL